jgi:hypothetical protein
MKGGRNLNQEKKLYDDSGRELQYTHDHAHVYPYGGQLSHHVHYYHHHHHYHHYYPHHYPTHREGDQ